LPSSHPPPAAFDAPVYVTRPLLPDLDVYRELLREVWSRQWLTNKGVFHDRLETALRERLGAPNLSLAGSGTMALLLAYRALGLAGEVITTPLTSPATVSPLIWCGLTPVFADVDPVALTLDPGAVERAITPRTSAIVGVHLYGMPGRLDELRGIAAKHRLRLVYDAAHCFGTAVAGVPIARFGDATAFSFHATKLFNTAEGGAVATPDPDLKRRIDLLRNIGIADEVSVPVAGINGRMNELEAALGLANLDLAEGERAAREKIAAVYAERLAGVEGLAPFAIPPHVRNSHAYFVLRVDHPRVSRDALCERLKAFNVFARRYFYPLVSAQPFCRGFPSAAPANLPAATRAAGEVLSLPLYGTLGTAGAHRICDMVAHILAG
jgi:dTDP-4-amino-4,6-dideoxygalactose transaminase